MQNQRSKFSLDEKAIYLNGAYMSPQLKSVEKAGFHALQRKNKPNRITGDHFFQESEDLRTAYASLINSSDPERIVIIPSVSYGMANVAANIEMKTDENIIVADEQFPSNVYPWMTLCDDSGAKLNIVKAPETRVRRGKNWNNAILDAIDEKTRIVALGHIHWADGTLFDLHAIREKASSVGALLIIDGTQSIGALPFDVDDIKPDALICAGYKWLMGPYSIGLAYYGPAFDGGKAVEQNWINRLNSEDFSGLVNYQHNYQPGALRYEVGEHSNFNHVPMLKTAIEQIAEWGIPSIQNYCKNISNNAITLLTKNGFYIEDEDSRSSHLFGIRLPEHLKMETVKNALNEANIFVSYRGDCIRVSPHVYNTESDMNKLASTLESVLAHQS